MRRPTIFACLVIALAMLTPTAVASAKKEGFVTQQAAMLDDAGNVSDVQITPLVTVGDVVAERLPLRSHPGRHRRLGPRPGTGRCLRQPRDEQGAVPVQPITRHDSAR